MQLHLSTGEPQLSGPLAVPANDSHVIRADSQVQCVAFCHLAWSSDLLLYGTDCSVVVVKLTLPQQQQQQRHQLQQTDDKWPAVQHETLFTVSAPAGAFCAVWCGETTGADTSSAPACLKFVVAGGLAGAGDAPGGAGGDHSLYQYCRTGSSDDDTFQVAPLSGHSDFVRDLAMSCDDVTLASTGDDATCRLWNTRSATSCATVRLSAPGVSVRWHSEQPAELLVATSCGHITIYTCLPCASAAQPPHPSAVSPSRDSAALRPLRVVPQRALTVWPTAAGELAAVDWHVPTGTLALLGLRQLATLALAPASDVTPVYTIGDSASRTVRYSNTAKPLLAACTLGQVRVSDPTGASGTQITDLPCVSGISWHAVGRYLAAASNDCITVWRVAST